jgi:hypothetical protein
VIRSRSSILRTAAAAMSVRLIVMQIALAALVFALVVLWLRLPDSSAVSVIATVLLGLIVLALASGGEMFLLLLLCARPRTISRVFKGALLIVAAFAVWLLWSWLITSLESGNGTLAGYLNSRVPASLRNFFSYAHIYRWLDWAGTIFQWIGAGTLAVVVYSLAASLRPRSAIRYALFSARYWVVLVVGGIMASELTGVLMHWTPGDALSLEMFSLIVRLAIVAVADTVIALFVLAVIAVCVQQSDALYETPAGGPDSSQPLTVEAP